jgi:ABC-type branched-subunit amino acid transport system substrate-binding protein
VIAESNDFRVSGKRRTAMKLPLSSTLILGAVALLFAASPATAQIKIGVFGPMSGDAAAYGQSMREGVEIAVKEQNAKGGVLGQQITVVYGDDAGKPEQAVNVAKRLATRDSVLVLLGSISSPASLAASQVAQESPRRPSASPRRAIPGFSAPPSRTRPSPRASPPSWRRNIRRRRGMRSSS